MSWTRGALVTVAGLGGLAAGAGVHPADVRAAAGTTSPASAAAIQRAGYGRLPLAFETNRGQTDASVRFMTRSRGMTAYFTPTETVFALHSGSADETAQDVVRMSFVGASTAPPIESCRELPGKSNYFIGSDHSKWITGVPNFEDVVERDVYPGVDVRWHGDAQQRLTYDLVVAPGADVASIAVALDGARGLAIGEDGTLRATTNLGELFQTKPIAFQTENGVRRPVEAAFKLTDGRVRFDLGAYDGSRPLVIDPSLTYSTYLGGTDQDAGQSIAVDGTGAAYVTGAARSTNFPVQSAFQGSLRGAANAFVTKINASGSAIVYSTYVGGSNGDGASGVALDATGAAYVTGNTYSTNFPTQSPLQATLAGNGDAFVFKLSASGSTLAYSTYLGGSGTEQAQGIAVDGSGAAYIAGSTASTDFPTLSPLQVTNAGNYDAFVAKVNASGSALVYSMYLGGNGTDQAQGIAVDGSGAAYIAGYTGSTDFPTRSPLQATFAGGSFDTFVAKVNASGSALVYSTFLGGTDSDQAYGIAVDSCGAAYIVGFTGSTNFPTQTPFQGTFGGGGDAFVAKVSAGGSSLVYSTYLGGNRSERATGIAVDSDDAAVVVGTTTSANFPTALPSQASISGSTSRDDAFVTKLDSSGSALVFSTYLGGTSFDVPNGVALDATGAAYVTGSTSSTDFPTQSALRATYAGGATDAFVAKYPLVSSGDGCGPALAAPTNLVATYADGFPVSLTWTGVSATETGFRVERKPNNYSFALLATTGANTTSYLDPLLYPGTTFTYRVRSFNLNRNSAWSNEASITTSIQVPIPPLPKAPNQLAVTAEVDASNAVSWTDNSADEVLFGLERAVGGDAFKSIVAVPTDVTGYADYDLHPGWPCTYRVRALSLQGPSPYSNPAAATLPGTLDVTMTSGSCTDSPKPKHDKVKLAATWAFPSSAPAGSTLDPVANGLALQLGAANAPIAVSIAAGDTTWKVRKTKATKTKPSVATSATWKSAKGALPKVTVVVDLVRHTLTATVTAADFSAPPTPDARLLVASGADGGAHETTWTQGKPGTFVLR